MTIPKKVERKTLYQDKMDYKGLDINDIIKYGADIEQERGYNQCHNELTAWVVGRLNKLPYKDNVEIQALIKELKDGK